MHAYILLFCNFIVGFFTLRFLRTKDIYNPEPVSTMSLFLFLGGGLSIILTLITTVILNFYGLYTEASVSNYFIFTGPIEEFFKFTSFLIVLKLFQVKIREPIDALIYIACTALGFSLVENFMYAQGFSLLIFIRVFSSTIIHVTCSCLLGLAYSRFISENRFSFILKAFILAALMHGAFNSLVSLGKGNILYLFIIICYFLAIKIFGYLNLTSPSYKTLSEEYSSTLKSEADKVCVCCKSSTKHYSFSLFNAMKTDECSQCRKIYLPEKTAQKFYQLFMPGYLNYRKLTQKWIADLNQSVPIFTDDKYNNFRSITVESTSMQFDRIANEIKNEFEKSWIFSFIFQTRPVFSASNGIANQAMDDFKNDVIKSQGAKAFAMIIAFFIFFGVSIALLIRFMK